MADVLERQLMKVTGFSDGTDTYKGVRGFQYRRNPQPSVGIRLEGELRPSRTELIETDTPPFAGTVLFSGPAPSALLDTTIAAATIDVRDVTDASSTETITVTNMIIKGVSANITNRVVGEHSYEFEATNVAAAPDA